MIAIIEYKKDGADYNVNITGAKWPEFLNVMNTGGKELNIKFLFEEHGHYTETIASSSN